MAGVAGCAQTENPCHNFVTLRTKFRLTRGYRETDNVAVTTCDILQVRKTERA